METRLNAPGQETTETAAKPVSPVAQEQIPSATDKLRSGLRLQFRQTPLYTVLNYLHEAAGFIIQVKPNVSVAPTVDVWHDKTVEPTEAVDLLKKALVKKDCAVIQRGRALNIMRTQDLKKTWIPLPQINLSAVPAGALS